MTVWFCYSQFEKLRTLSKILVFYPPKACLRVLRPIRGTAMAYFLTAGGSPPQPYILQNRNTVNCADNTIPLYYSVPYYRQRLF